LESLSNCGSEDAAVQGRPPGGDPDTSKVLPKSFSLAQLSTELPLTNFSTMESLQILDLSSNMLKKLDKNFLKQFPNLRELNVSHNQIDFLNGDFFKGSNNLRVVDLSSNRLNQTMDPHVFVNLPKNLQYIDFSSKKREKFI